MIRSTVLGLLVLAGCGSPAALELAGFDPLTAELGAASATVSLPAGVGLTPGDAGLRLTGTRAADGREASAAVALRVIEVSGPVTERRRITFALGEDGAQALEPVRAEIRDWKAAGARGTAALTVDLKPCRHADALPRALPVTVWLGLPGRRDPVRLVEDRDLAEIVGEATVRELPPCGPGAI